MRGMGTRDAQAVVRKILFTEAKAWKDHMVLAQKSFLADVASRLKKDLKGATIKVDAQLEVQWEGFRGVIAFPKDPAYWGVELLFFLWMPNASYPEKSSETYTVEKLTPEAATRDFLKLVRIVSR